MPKDFKAPSSDTDNWPRLVQLAWIVTDDDGHRLKESNLIVRPDGFEIPEETSRIHGITTERALKEGIPLEDAISAFRQDLKEADCIVGHNVVFDKKIVGAEMIRLGLNDELNLMKSLCTMMSSIDFCQLPAKNGIGFKYPRLQELYVKLFGKQFDDAHNAMCDINATEQCFWKLRKMGLL